MCILSLPIVFIHRTAEEHVGLCVQQAKYSNPSSRVILIGKPETKQLSTENTEHYLLSKYFKSAQAYSFVYKHSSPTPYEYNLFCFQRWFILRDFMRSQGIDRCCYLDSDVMLYTDISKQNDKDFHDFTFEFTWTTVCDLDKLDQFCEYTTKFFRDPLHYENLLQFAKEIGDVPISDMVLFTLFHNYALRRGATYGLVANGFFDHNLNCPFAPSCPQANSLETKKQIYQKDGMLFCKITETNNYLPAHSLHFQGHAKGYIPYFRSQDIPNTDDYMYFDYPTCKWVRAEP
ncbi:hypothetical protein POF51_21885 [Brevibacillus sp. AG]|uniref:hypothetical protein n=1 Tax=Brevibacillus sp. AG TaxID=3020891 RepID=UPI001FCDB518|nr:hypothetical protein [Brevibacillus sp. AG]MDC0763377.1 hypothetical protein [Brevibacillus sp. AG]